MIHRVALNISKERSITEQRFFSVRVGYFWTRASVTPWLCLSKRKGGGKGQGKEKKKNFSPSSEQIYGARENLWRQMIHPQFADANPPLETKLPDLITRSYHNYRSIQHGFRAIKKSFTDIVVGQDWLAVLPLPIYYTIWLTWIQNRISSHFWLPR